MIGNFLDTKGDDAEMLRFLYAIIYTQTWFSNCTCFHKKTNKLWTTCPGQQVAVARSHRRKLTDAAAHAIDERCSLASCKYCSACRMPQLVAATDVVWDQRTAKCLYHRHIASQYGMLQFFLLSFVKVTQLMYQLESRSIDQLYFWSYNLSRCLDVYKCHDFCEGAELKIRQRCLGNATRHLDSVLRRLTCYCRPLRYRLQTWVLNFLESLSPNIRLYVRRFIATTLAPYERPRFGFQTSFCNFHFSGFATVTNDLYWKATDSRFHGRGGATGSIFVQSVQCNFTL